MRKQSSCICTKDATTTQAVAPPQLPPAYISPQLSSLTNDIASAVYQSGPNQQMVTDFLVKLSSETGINITHPAILPVALPLMMRYAAEGRHFSPADDGLKAPEPATARPVVDEYFALSARRARSAIVDLMSEMAEAVSNRRTVPSSDLDIYVGLCIPVKEFLTNMMVSFGINPELSELEENHVEF